MYQKVEKRSKKKEPLNLFDARIFEISKDQLYNYFSLRQAFQIEHVTTRLCHLLKQEKLSKEVCSRELTSAGFPADEIYYGCIFKPDAEIAPFDFEGNKEHLEQLFVFD